MRNFKYKSIFANAVKCIIGEEKGKYLSLASIDELRAIIPKNALDNGKEDLLPIASNLAVVNLKNLNDDAVDTKTVLAMANSLLEKPVNIEHGRDRIVGHIVSVGFSKFDSSYKTGVGSELIEASTLTDVKTPFNICYAAYIYKLVNESLVDSIINSSDPDSEDYLTVSSSFEIGFDTYDIAVGSMDLENASIISNETEKERFESLLKVNGGTGRTEDGKYVYRVITGEPMFLGAALTESPAAAVSGVVTLNTQKDDNEKLEDADSVGSKGEKQNYISQKPKINVKEDDNMKTIAKIDDLKKLTQDDVKDLSLANIVETVYQALQEASETYCKQIKEKEDVLAEAKKNSETYSKQLETITKELNEIKAEQTRIETEKQFNLRMAHVDENYDLDDEQRKAIASDINGLDEAAFAAWMTKFDVLAKNSKKGNKKVFDKVTKKWVDPEDLTDKDEDTEDGSGKKNAKASDTEEAKRVASEALAKAEKEKQDAAIAANAQKAEQDELEKYRKAFGEEGVIVKL
jgi:hypothetical protein